MKAKINNENKAKFFALYFGQNVLENPLGVGIVNGRSIDYVMTNSMVAHLNLKPLSQISDDDAIEVAKMVVGDKFSNLLIIGKSYAHWLHKNPLYALDWKVVDYLRSRGYALPWMGLSVEDLVQAGWIRLIEL